MKTLLLAMLIISSFSLGAADCDSLEYNDAKVLCKQNKRILRKLNHLEETYKSDVKGCIVTYCAYNGRPETTQRFRDNCDDPRGSWNFKNAYVEARNVAHAHTLFLAMDLNHTGDLAVAFESAKCE